MSRGRTITTAGLAAVAALALVAALILGYASRAIFDADQFADRASAALASDAVSDEVAVKVADELVQADPDLVAVRPVLESVVAGIVRTGAFQGIFRAGVSDLHRAVFEDDAGSVTMTLVDIGTTLRGVLEAVQPTLAEADPPRGGRRAGEGEGTRARRRLRAHRRGGTLAAAPVRRGRARRGLRRRPALA